MENHPLNSKLEFGLYITVFVIGVLLVIGSYFLYSSDQEFAKDLLLNLGANMTVLTLVFSIYKFFSGRSRVPPELRGKLSEFASPSRMSSTRDYDDENPNG